MERERPNPALVIRVASLMDPAVLWRRSNPETGEEAHPGGTSRVEYARSRDAALVVPVPGKLVTWFTLRPIGTRDFNRFVMAAGTEAERFERAFITACTKIENLCGVDGRLYPTVTPRKDQESLGDEALDLVSAALVFDVGQVAWTRSFFAHSSEISYPLLLSWPLVSAAVTCLPAAAPSATAGPSSAPSATASTPTPASGGEPPTAAPATALPDA